jgi:hypothetical protein
VLTDFRRIWRADTLSEFVGPVTIGLKRDAHSSDLFVAVKFVGLLRCSLNADEFDHFARNVDCARIALREEWARAADSVGVTRSFDTSIHGGWRSISICVRRQGAGPWIEILFGGDPEQAVQLGGAEFEDFARNVQRMRNKFPPGSLPQVEWESV